MKRGCEPNSVVSARPTLVFLKLFSPVSHLNEAEPSRSIYSIRVAKYYYFFVEESPLWRVVMILSKT